MLIKELVDNKNKLKEYSELINKMKVEEPNIDWEKYELNGISARFRKYDKFNMELKDKFKEMSFVEDAANEDTTGVYVCPLNEANMIKLYSNYEIVRGYEGVHMYGICDNATQVLKYYQENIEFFDNNRTYIITLTPIFKKNQPEIDGWRWGKWGEYIGVQNRKSEYLYDEDDIDMVYVFDIREILEK